MIILFFLLSFYINTNTFGPNFKLKSIQKIKNLNETPIKFYFHNHGIKIISFSCLKKKENNSIELLILLDNSPSKYFKILNNNEILKKEENFHIFIKDNKKYLSPNFIEKLDPNLNYISIFGKKKINFGELYKVKWNFEKNINLENIKFILKNSNFIFNF